MKKFRFIVYDATFAKNVVVEAENREEAWDKIKEIAETIDMTNADEYEFANREWGLWGEEDDGDAERFSTAAHNHALLR